MNESTGDATDWHASFEGALESTITFTAGVVERIPNETLFYNTNSDNTASGVNALHFNTTGSANIASGTDALLANTSGGGNTDIGISALGNIITGNNNIAIGAAAGSSLHLGSSNNIDIGAPGAAGETGAIHIGQLGFQTATYIQGVHSATVAGGIAVVVDSIGHFGVSTSSARFKENIQPMDQASEAILALRPVTFRYKHELDPQGIPQFGLVAEQVAKGDPDLVARDDQGKAYTVRYEAVNAMLLNEFLKEHRQVQELKATVAELKSTLAQLNGLQTTVAQQQQEIQGVTAALKAQAAQIQKVSDQLRAQAITPRVVADN